MDGLFEIILGFILEALKFIIYVIIWSHILFYIGVFVLKILSFSKYPIGQQFKYQLNFIALIGCNAIYLSWSAIATYNFSENIYFLAIGLAVATVQFFLIVMKYYYENRSSYEL